MRTFALTTHSDDAPADRYHFSYQEASPYGHAVALVNAHAKHPGEVVIDIGCGFGAIAEPLRECGFTYVGLDLEPSGLADLERRGFATGRLDLRETGELRSVLEGALGQKSLGAITALDIIEHLTNGPEVLAILHDFCLAHGEGALVVSIPNVAHIDLGAKLLLGRWDVTPTGLLDETHVALYSPARLERTFLVTGWSEVGRADFELMPSDQHFPADAAAIRAESPLGDFLRRIREKAAPGATTNQFVRAYRPIALPTVEEVAPNEANGCFLSVVLLVGGSNLAMLEDVLTSLDAQSCQDFELLVVPFDLGEDELAEMEALIGAHCFGLASKTKVIKASDAKEFAAGRHSRGTLFNAAIRRAAGRYVTFLDADVVPFGRWIEEFAALVGRAPGAVVRVIGADQPFDATTWPSRRSGYEAVAGPEVSFPARFSAIHELISNHSPSGTYALPMSCFSDLGLRFDEQLTSGVDWELFLRAALMCGVEDSATEVTLLRRCWPHARAACGDASDARAEKSAHAVASHLDAEPLLLPPGSVSAIRGLFASAEELRDRVRSIERERDWFAQERVERERCVDQGELAALRAEIDAFRASRSWRLTAPVRWATRLVRRVRTVWRNHS
jgi:hypothetical protein